MTVDDKVDVAIIGAGVGGAMLALSLGRAGVNVLVLESGPGVPTRGADFLKPRGIRVLRDHGVLPAVLDKGALRRDKINYYHDGQPLLELDFAEHSELGYYLVAPYGTIVESLVEACAECPSVTIEFDSAVKHIDRSNDSGHIVYVHNGRTVHAGIVVGADGFRSPVLTYVDASLAIRAYDHRMHATTLAAPMAERTGRLYFSSAGSFAYFYPVADDAARVFVGLPPALDETLGAERGAMLVEHLGSFVTDEENLPALADLAWQQVPVGAWQSPRLAHGTAVVLGHAAFSAHPMTGLGMSVTLEDATVIAAAITEALHTGQPADQLLAEWYHRPRQDIHRRLIAYGDALATSFPSVTSYRRCFQPRLHCGDR